MSINFALSFQSRELTQYQHSSRVQSRDQTLDQAVDLLLEHSRLWPIWDRASFGLIDDQATGVRWTLCMTPWTDEWKETLRGWCSEARTETTGAERESSDGQIEITDQDKKEENEDEEEE